MLSSSIAWINTLGFATKLGVFLYNVFKEV